MPTKGIFYGGGERRCERPGLEDTNLENVVLDAGDTLANEDEGEERDTSEGSSGDTPAFGQFQVRDAAWSSSDGGWGAYMGASDLMGQPPTLSEGRSLEEWM